MREALESGLECCRLADLLDEVAAFRASARDRGVTASLTNELLLGDALKDEVERFKRLARDVLFGPDG
jgi:hypothetical protein